MSCFCRKFKIDKISTKKMLSQLTFQRNFPERSICQCFDLPQPQFEEVELQDLDQ